MFLFDWKKIYERADGNILLCNKIMEMLITDRVPKNKYDEIYELSKTNFKGQDFLVHGDVALLHAYKYSQRELAVYYAMAALRPVANYMASGVVTLPLLHSPVTYELLADNRLLSIKNDTIHFKYEEVQEIH